MARILVIDDTDSSGFAVRGILDSSGHEVIELGPRDGLPELLHSLPEALRDQPPDLILIDPHIPCSRGLTRFVRQFQHRVVPILIYSGLPQDDLRKAARALQAAGVVRKDASVEELRRGVRWALTQARALSRPEKN